jgi:hypothetical protein
MEQISEFYFPRMGAVHASYYLSSATRGRSPTRLAVSPRDRLVQVRPLARIPLVLLCALALVAPAPASAQDSPFAPLPTPAPDTTPTQTQPSSPSTTSKGIGTAATVGLFVAAIVLLTGIAYVIRRDARSSTAKAEPKRRARPAVPPAPPPPGARGRPTGKASAQKRRKRPR